MSLQVLPLREYELAIIFSSKLESKAESRARSFFSSIESAEGSVKELNVLGQRKLAYDIKDNKEAISVVVKFLAGAKSIAELNRQLRLAEDVVRAKLVRVGRK